MAGEFIRSFAKFFTNLTVPQRQEIERAFADFQNAKEITSLDESLRLLKRKPDQRLPIPELAVTPTVRGAIVEWEALPDQRINFYEVDVSSTSNFASFTTIPTFGLQFVVDGLTATRFVRVRGIRRDGTTTPYSDTATLEPEVFQIRAHVEEAFYVNITGYGTHTIIGGTGTDLDYTPLNPDGNSMVWGFITAYANPASAMFGEAPVQASVMVETTDPDGTVTDEEYMRLSFGEFFNSQNIGPFVVPHPAAGGSLAIRITMTDQTVDEDLSARAKDPTKVQWCHLNVLEIGNV